ncbi:unnamed protein product [Sphagnum jensenii]|uniref:Uncharacterized protein n=1 Tax=Sphagnum jensenii TaxID=128206 RepID=A0ABP1B6J6_9BRYO
MKKAWLVNGFSSVPVPTPLCGVVQILGGLEHDDEAGHMMMSLLINADQDVPNMSTYTLTKCTVAAGTPAKVVGFLEEPTPSLTMKHGTDLLPFWRQVVFQL